MNHSIAPGAMPPPKGLEKEEPELAEEEDIPTPSNDGPNDWATEPARDNARD